MGTAEQPFDWASTTRILFETSIDGVLLTAPDGRIFGANPAACTMLGRTEEELCRLGRAAVVDESDPALWAALEERRRSGRSRAQFRLVRGDGSRFVAEVTSVVFETTDGEPRASIIFRDISEQKRLEQALRESEQRFRLLSDAAFEGVAIHQFGVVRELNRAWAQLFGYEPEEIVGMQIVDFAAPESREQVLALIAQGSSEPYEYVGIRKDGSRFACVANGRTIAIGEQPARVVTARDVSDEKRLEAERDRFRRRMHEADKAESLALLAGGVAHDFNNLLLAILGNASLAREALGPDSPARELLAQIILAAERASILSGQMLAFSGRGRGVVEPIVLAELAREWVGEEVLELPDSIVLQSELDGRACVRGDRGQLGQLLHALLRNAAEAIGDQQGVITLRVGSTELGTAELASVRPPEALAPGAYAFVEVDDTGEGMDEETLLRMFEPFYSTHFTGRGLGLAAALGIARAHAGGFQVESAPGRGTRIRVLLPPREAGIRDAGAA